MTENDTRRPDADDDSLIFVEGTMLELESVESAIDALARDELLRDDEDRKESDEEIESQ